MKANEVASIAAGLSAMFSAVCSNVQENLPGYF